MDSSIEMRIIQLRKSVDQWLSSKNFALKEAIDKSVKDGHFSFEDIKYQLLSLKKTLKESEFRRWTKRADVVEINSPKNILCLHAGNLPLVGIQDILAVALSGHHYMGKLSRKDPYLPATLLEVLNREGLIHGDWSVKLNDLKNNQADAILFSGSATTVSPVMDSLITLNIATHKTPRLLRTAHYSLALIEDDHPDTMEQLANAVFRYGGKGCRSVAMVVAPYSLNSKKCSFTDYVESFWLKNPQHKKAPPSLYHRYAYNKAAEINQSWLDNFLIEETDMEPVEPFILHWVKGDRQTVARIAEKYREGLQTVYVKDPSVNIEGLSFAPELLTDAQQPPIWWKPDGVDPLNWLMKL